MRRGPKPAKSKVEAKRPVARKSPKSDGASVRDLEKRLAEALRDKAEALERETATSKVLSVISRSLGDLGPVFEAMLANAVRLCEASFGNLLLYDGDAFPHLRVHNAPRGWAAEQERDPVPPRDLARVLYRVPVTKQIVHVADIAAENPDEPIATIAGARTLLIVPMLKENKLIGVIAVYRQEVRPFGEKPIDLLTNFAAQAVIAIENVRLFTELQASNRELTTALDQQTATAEILRVISSSPTDIRPVFDAIVASATRLCDAGIGAVVSFDGELMHLQATRNWTPEFDAAIRPTLPAPPSRAFSVGRAILERTVVHVPDVELDAEYMPEFIRLAGFFRSVLAVPLLRDGLPLGGTRVARAAPGPFADNQSGLLKPFRSQAVIAIENVRLFNETKEALDRQTATSEILRVISSSPTN